MFAGCWSRRPGITGRGTTLVWGCVHGGTRPPRLLAPEAMRATAACTAGGWAFWNAASARRWPMWRSPASWPVGAGRGRSWRTDRHLICFLLECGGGSAWIDPRTNYEQTFGSTLDPRRADAIQPKPRPAVANPRISV